MAYPKIAFNGNLWLFTYPDVQKPGPHDGNGDHLVGQRSDRISISGLKQSIYWRTDQMRDFQLDDVPFSDLPTCRAFFDWAIPGGTWDHYADADAGEFTTFTLEDTEWKPQFNVRGLVKFSFTGRKYVAGT